MSDFSVVASLAAVRAAINDPGRLTRRRTVRNTDGPAAEGMGAWQARAALAAATAALATSMEQLHIVVPAEQGGWWCQGCRSETTQNRCPTLHRIDQIRASIEEGM